MLSLTQESDQELIKHICKLCDKSFPSGRSLGGHMRSHVINSTDYNHNNHRHEGLQQKKKKMIKKLSAISSCDKSMKNNTVFIDGSSNSNDSGYELRKDPKKTPKVKDASELENNLVVLDKLCKECGKGFQSWKALFGHMKCHSEKVLNNHTNNNNIMNQDYLTGHLDNENSGTKAGQTKKSRSRNKSIKRYIVTTTMTTSSSSLSMNVNDDNNKQISSNHASTSIASEIDQDQESEIAMCLMMLSRDERKWGKEIESYDHCNSSAFVKLTKDEGKKLQDNGSKNNKIGILGRSEVGYTESEKIIIQDDNFDNEIELGFGKFEDSSKRKFECITCDKSFHSYQALGGHKASHKKLKTTNSSNNHQATKSFNLGASSLKKTVVLGTHECPICLKIFSSGQALGGHKRSHLVAESKMIQKTSMNLIEKVSEPVHEIRAFLDVNMLPDTMEEDMIMNSSTTVYMPWHWVDTNNHESKTLLGLLSTS
ncbi:zinc finger protein ZAT9-like [Rutidosis leptorrhynchoides]|uniref:zinc finger protein ZAT9-like n=1 Tax=Rutidosis leptorrhynchoides TaxID=125765 RepID=UPI003A9A28CB